MEKGIKNVGIIGAGLVGSLLAIYLAKRGYDVSVFERRPDLRLKETDEGRSINLALSARGLRALEEIGLAAQVKAMAIPMHGRMMHDIGGALTFLPYGKEGQYINSISRTGLNNLLASVAESHGVKFFFNHRCLRTDIERTSAMFQHLNEPPRGLSFGLMIGADGVFSAVRGAMQVTDRFDYSQEYLEHGYKELEIPAGPGGAFALEKNALHIWPRESFMMIALPNPDGTFTCTLFLPFEGSVSFAALSSKKKVTDFFKKEFPDAVPLMPALGEEYRKNPTSSLVTVRCFPWTKNNTLLIGDAAHGILPFYGQGMNAGFEDCRILNGLLDTHRDKWTPALKDYQQRRKPDTDAIARLAVDNFVEMRDHVADPEFLLRKKIEARLHDLYPEKWIPLYSMVTFHDQIPYSAAYATGRRQAAIMDDVMNTPDVSDNWEKLDFKKIADRLA